MPAPAQTFSDYFRQLIVLGLACGQIVSSVVFFASGFEPAAPETAGPMTGPTPIEPAGYAFIIWGLIFLASVAYGIYQAAPSRRTEPLLRQTGWWAALAFASCIAWNAAAKYGPLWATVPLILGIAVPVTRVFLLASGARGWTRRLVTLPFALYAGWVTVAVFANAVEVANGYGFQWLGVPLQMWVVAAVAAAAGLALYGLKASHYQPLYAATVVWALTAIVVANLQRSGPAAVIAAASAAALLVAALTLRRRPRRPTPVA